jgi:outer membrane protein OmpA-like peptidoglycan-associated protein
MFLKRSFSFLLALTLSLSVTNCSFNPFTTDNHLTGSPGAAIVGGAAGAGTAALLHANKYFIALAGFGGAALGYYMTTENFKAGGIVRAGGQVFSVGSYVTIEIPTDSIFEDNSSDFLPEAGPALDSTLAVLQNYPNNNILISGNTSGYGLARWEISLSEKRAREVSAYLWAHGISSYKEFDAVGETRVLGYVGYGNAYPIANHIKASSIRSNSRIQITSYPSQSELGLCAKQRVYANIGGMKDEPIDQRSPEPYIGNAFKGEVLPEN